MPNTFPGSISIRPHVINSLDKLGERARARVCPPALTCVTVWLEVLIGALIDWGSRGAHGAPGARWLWFPRIRLLSYFRDLMQFVPGANQICKRARPREPLISTHFHGPVKFLRSRLKGSSFPCGSISRIIVLLETIQLFNYQDISPRSSPTPPPFSFLSFLFTPLSQRIRTAYQGSPLHDTTQNKNKGCASADGRNIRLEVRILEELFITI